MVMSSEEKNDRRIARKGARSIMKLAQSLISDLCSIAYPGDYGDGFASYVERELVNARRMYSSASSQLVANGGKL